ncbi:MAG: long-chain-fatty-acid--CoA ligase [Rhodospirillaceae bacterium]|nr:long-chain-fatty-acid--CoA ligase [Rhodospirillaceae bacterium]
MLTMSSALDRCRRLYGGRKAIVDAEGTWNWTEHLSRVARAARALRDLGVGRGDRFGILSRNLFRHCELLHAGYWMGAVPVPVNIRLAPPEIAFILGDAGVKALAVDEAFLPLVDNAMIAPFAKQAFAFGPKALGGKLPDYENLIASGGELPLVESREDDDAILLYTGGTTGRSKGVRLTHRNVVSNGMQCAMEMGFRGSDTYLHIAPMFHSADLLGTGFTLLGGSHAYLPQFSPRNMLAAIEERRVTCTMMAPTMIIMTLQELKPADFDLSSFRWFLYGSAPMAPEWIAKSLEAFPGVEVCQGYGLTETAPILTYLDFDEHKKALASGNLAVLKAAGRPIAGVDMRILDDKGEEVPLGQPGEVVVRAPNVTKGYLNLPDATAAAIRKGWFHTGDVGRMDEEGFMYLLDRKKDMIITGGENVYTVEVEQAIYQHPAVAECAVVGVPDDKYGESLFAAVVLHQGKSLTKDEIIEHCRARIGGYKVPRQMAFLPALPKSAMGKILKTELRRLYSDPARRAG